MYGADPGFFPLGTKSGCRRLFARKACASARCRGPATPRRGRSTRSRHARRQAGSRQALVKLNEGVAGRGNALVDLAEFRHRATTDERTELSRRVAGMSFENERPTLDAYLAKLAGPAAWSRSDQGSELPEPERAASGHAVGRGRAALDPRPALGRAERPALPRLPLPGGRGIRAHDRREAARIGERLAREGVLGRFAVDFVDGS